METTSAAHTGSSLTDSLSHHDSSHKLAESPPSPFLLGLVLVIVGAIGFSPWYVAKKAREAADSPNAEVIFKNARALGRSHMLHPGATGVSSKVQVALQYRMEGKYEDSIREFNDVLVHPQSVEKRALNLLVRGDCFLNLGQYDKALDDFNKSIELVPNDRDAYMERATAYFRMGKKDLYARDLLKARSFNR
ncbi:MAG TPA: tetratricopeptide repeat protein [Oculatellaceae cyanobacterium]